MSVQMIKGDLFDSKDNLVHCVSADLRMGAGIAKEFKRRFGRVNQLLAQNPRVGNFVHLKLNDGTYIFYLVTKEKCNQKPLERDLESSLNQCWQFCQANNIRTLSMPKIGCGLDRLDWPSVLEIIRKIFINVHVKIHHLI